MQQAFGISHGWMMCVRHVLLLIFESLDDVAGLNTIWPQPSTKSPGETCAGAASLVASRGDLVASLPGPARSQPPTSALMMSPNRSHVLPLKRISCNCDS